MFCPSDFSRHANEEHNIPPPLVSSIQSVHLDVYYLSSLILAKRVTQINKFYFTFYQSSAQKTQLHKVYQVYNKREPTEILHIQKPTVLQVR